MLGELKTDISAASHFLMDIKIIKRRRALSLNIESGRYNKTPAPVWMFQYNKLSVCLSVTPSFRDTTAHRLLTKVHMYTLNDAFIHFIP